MSQPPRPEDYFDIPGPARWIADAACAEIGGEEFFPDGRIQATAAKQICEGCPVLQECFAYAMGAYQHGYQGVQGVWGGTTTNERQQLRKRQQGNAA